MPDAKQPDLFDPSKSSAAEPTEPPPPVGAEPGEGEGPGDPPVGHANGQAALPDGPLRRLMDENFLQYASYVIRDRAIPQLEDGLKPVQRRILHALWENDDGNLHKVANIVGETMKYHPHGDASIADALVGIVQKRYLIEGQGNFGNIFTGAPAAAARYPECRLTELARNEVFNPKLTGYVASYDGRNKEPITLPSKLPLLLMLGSEGIAVGLATRILPHNFNELIKAQIAILQDKKFKILPDFMQGGLMDASEYDLGRGKVTVRALVEAKDNKLIIRQIPFSTTTESLIASIENAARSKKIKIRSIDDFTAENVEIVLTLSQGEDPEKTLAALFHFTQCEISLNSNIICIHGDKPVEMTVEEVLRANTTQLLATLKSELDLRQRELDDEFHFKSLVRLFIENRIYKGIEEQLTYEAVQQAVLKGLRPYRDQLTRDISIDDVEMLLDLRIKRISKFDLKKNQEDLDNIVKELKQVQKNLSQPVPYAVAYLDSLLATYGKDYKRRTKLTTVEETDVRELTANQLAIVYDPESGSLGSALRGNPTFRCSPLDKVLLIRADGRYSIISPPEKEYVGKDILHVAKYDRDHVFTVVYTANSATFLKRCTLGGAIMNKEYTLCLEGEQTNLLFFSAASPKRVTLKFRKAKGIRKNEETFALNEYPVRSVKTRGNQLSRKPVNSVVAA